MLYPSAYQCFRPTFNALIARKVFPVSPADGWLDGWMMRCYIKAMDAFDSDSLATDLLPTDLAVELESRFFWWEPVGSQPRSHARILAQAMDLASFDDVRRFERTLGPQKLAEAMLNAEPGWIGARSWEFWRGRLALATGRTMPEAPPQRSFDAGQF